MLRRREEILKRRRLECLKCPTTKMVDYHLEKYQATDATIQEIR